MRSVAALSVAAGLMLLAVIPAAGADTPCAAARCMADLSVSSRTSVSPVQVGGTTELHLTAANNGPEPASGVSIDVTPPAGVAIVSAVDACTPDGLSAHCTIGDLAVGDSSEVVLVVRGTRAGVYELRSTISATGSDDDNATNDTGDSGLQVEGAASPATTTPAKPGTATAPATTAARFRITDTRRQRILKAGGLLLHVRPEGGGDLDATATVALPGGRTLKLAGVFRPGVRTGQSVRVWLGTTPAMKRSLRTALKARAQLTARVRVRYGTTKPFRVVLRSISITR